MNKRERDLSAGNNLEVLGYTSAPEATALIDTLDPKSRLEMASVYQQAFAGYPWYEVVACKQCGEFAKEGDTCSHCQGTVFAEAYPTEWLLKEYLPQMVADYVPGVLILAKDETDSIQGFSCGGGIKLGELIEHKYKGKPDILESITTNSEVNPEKTVFYENETCISPTVQQKGMGSQLNFARVKQASELGFEHVCGRTINLPWLEVKKRHFAQFGYDCAAFYPEGDTYEVDGQRRFFFMATKRNGEN
ncbi:MAG: hypothetical protein Q7S31_00995 [bacterium]|nr:hypothetical protein [bacterium]